MIGGSNPYGGVLFTGFFGCGDCGDGQKEDHEQIGNDKDPWCHMQIVLEERYWSEHRCVSVDVP